MSDPLDQIKQEIPTQGWQSAYGLQLQTAGYWYEVVELKKYLICVHIGKMEDYVTHNISFEAWDKNEYIFDSEKYINQDVSMSDQICVGEMTAVPYMDNTLVMVDLISRDLAYVDYISEAVELEEYISRDAEVSNPTSFTDFEAETTVEHTILTGGCA